MQFIPGLSDTQESVESAPTRLTAIGLNLKQQKHIFMESPESGTYKITTPTSTTTLNHSSHLVSWDKVVSTSIVAVYNRNGSSL